MRRGTIRAGLLGAAMVALTVGPAPAAQATHSWCSSGRSFTTATADTVQPPSPDWWTTTASGRTTVTLTAADPSATITLYTTPNGNCTVVCTSTSSCTVDHTGPLNISVTAGVLAAPVPYVLTAANTSSLDCAQTTSVCVAAVRGAEVTRVDVRVATTTVAATHTVVGTLDTYRFPLPNGASVTLPCVTLTLNGTTTNPCAEADGQYVTTLAELVDESVNQPGAALTPPIESVGVCETRYTVTVATIGVENFPAYSLC